MTTAAIMQPTYLPWLGYFGLMNQVDIFVLLDSVQFEKRSWQQRNMIKTVNGSQWLTVPVYSKGRRGQEIRQVEIDRERAFAENHLRSITQNYAGAPYFDPYKLAITEILNRGHILLADLTIGLIEYLRDLLKISTPLVRSSELNCSGTREELLKNICCELNTDQYLSPPGSKTYLDESEVFEKSGIEIDYFIYEHPEYDQQYGEFASHMSVIDLIFNMGVQSADIIRKGIH